MIPLIYILASSIALTAVALAGIASDRHFIIVMLAVELMFVASTIALMAFFSYQQSPDPSAVPMLISIWTVAAVEIITVITFYVYMKSKNFDFDITKLSKLKW